MSAAPKIRLFNSLTRRVEAFDPVHPGEARIYSCGPTVYNYPHIGNMRAYVFADTLGRTLSAAGYKLTHIINITDVGHLTSDADAGEDKLEKAASEQARSIWDIARHYTEAYWEDVRRLNIRQPAKWSVATDHVAEMIAFAKAIEAKHCYRLPTGLYFDVTTVPDYGRLARAASEEDAGDGQGRIAPVDGKRNAADFAIWRTSPPGETRQMEWDSPWGRGAPGWHLECSVMSHRYLGYPFDIHTGGIDHREIHHPNEIAQNQAYGCTADSGARFWMHNNFLVERAGKMSKSSGEFLTLQRLIDRGYHPLAYRMLCLTAHYRSELEFSWEALGAALTRLKRLVMAVESSSPERGGVEGSPPPAASRLPPPRSGEEWHPKIAPLLAGFDAAMADDLNTPRALVLIEELAALKKVDAGQKRAALAAMDAVLGLDLLALDRTALRVRPKEAAVDEGKIEAILAQRKAARADRDFATSDALRDQLMAQGIEVMDGDPLGWDWRLG